MKLFRVRVVAQHANPEAYLTVEAESEQHARELVQARIEDESDDFEDADWDADSLDGLRVRGVWQVTDNAPGCGVNGCTADCPPGHHGGEEWRTEGVRPK